VSFCCVVVLGVTGCPKPSTPTEDAGTPTVTVLDSGLETASTGSAVFSLQYVLPDAGLEAIPWVGEEEGQPLIEPTSTLELRSTQALHNYRVRVFDEADRALESDDTAEESPTGIVYRISLSTPLKTGHRYVLIVDAQTGTAMTDAQGHELADVRMAFQVAGEKEKPPPPAKKQKQRRR
jgi:hypothetical protein